MLICLKMCPNVRGLSGRLENVMLNVGVFTYMWQSIEEGRKAPTGGFMVTRRQPACPLLSTAVLDLHRGCLLAGVVLGREKAKSSRA